LAHYGLAIDGNGDYLSVSEFILSVGTQGLLRVDSTSGSSTIVSSGGAFAGAGLNGDGGASIAIDENGDIVMQVGNTRDFVRVLVGKRRPLFSTTGK